MEKSIIYISFLLSSRGCRTVFRTYLPGPVNLPVMCCHVGKKEGKKQNSLFLKLSSNLSHSVDIKFEFKFPQTKSIFNTF